MEKNTTHGLKDFLISIGKFDISSPFVQKSVEITAGSFNYYDSHQLGYLPIYP